MLLSTRVVTNGRSTLGDNLGSAVREHLKLCRIVVLNPYQCRVRICCCSKLLLNTLEQPYICITVPPFGAANVIVKLIHLFSSSARIWWKLSFNLIVGVFAGLIFKFVSFTSIRYSYTTLTSSQYQHHFLEDWIKRLLNARHNLRLVMRLCFIFDAQAMRRCAAQSKPGFQSRQKPTTLPSASLAAWLFSSWCLYGSAIEVELVTTIFCFVAVSVSLAVTIAQGRCYLYSILSVKRLSNCFTSTARACIYLLIFRI